jgi:hypothetical protein
MLDPGVEHLDALEISPLVLGLCRDGFPRDRGGLSTDPRSHVRLVDGRVFIAAQRQAYEVILGDLFVPWREGFGYLSAAGILREDWAGFVGERWCGSVSARLADSSLGEGLSPAVLQGIAAGQCWVEAERAALAGDHEATQARVARALEAMPASVLGDTAFVWEDLLVDVPLPIPRHYRRPAR